ncbi:MAG TPA: hypothetical protein PKA77_08910 [Chitinophagaceae bacterium]|jgi:hypothetical protein|nr:hypothetical protein [Chitinophagaceae bacterium]HMU58582.1 hypothetical protein [Chitinophagaceae bacterium]
MNKILWLFCTLGFSASCNLFEADEAFEVPHKDLLTRNKWVLDAYTQSPAYNGVTDVYAKMSDCAKDNLLIFQKDGSYILDEGFKKCSESEPQTKVAGTWKFAENGPNEVDKFDENELIINSSGKITNYYIELITDSRLKISTTINSDGKTYEILQTFRKK